MSLVPYRPSLRPRALRPQLKRDPLGGSTIHYSSEVQ